MRRAPWRSGRDPEPGLHPALLHDDQAAWRPPREGPRRRIQFETLFTDGLYEKIGIPAIRNARKIQDALRASGYELLFESPTNQIFVVLENTQMAELAKSVAFSFWEKKDDTHTVVRFATSWATRDEDADELVRLLKDMRLA